VRGVWQSVRASLGAKLEEMEANARQYTATHTELEALRAERHTTDVELRQLKAENAELKAANDKMSADEQQKLEVMVMQLNEAREEADKARTALERYQSDPSILAAALALSGGAAARGSFAVGLSSAGAAAAASRRNSGSRSQRSSFNGGSSAPKEDGGGSSSSGVDGDSKDVKSDGSAPGIGGVQVDKRKSFTLPIASPLTGNESHSALKQKVIDLYNQVWCGCVCVLLCAL
jgi:hypothetical protein